MLSSSIFPKNLIADERVNRSKATGTSNNTGRVHEIELGDCRPRVEKTAEAAGILKEYILTKIWARKSLVRAHKAPVLTFRGPFKAAEVK